MNTSPAYRSSVGWLARFAYAAGMACNLANPFLIAYPAWRTATRKTGLPSARSERVPQKRPRSYSGVSRDV